MRLTASRRLTLTHCHVAIAVVLPRAASLTLTLTRLPARVGSHSLELALFSNFLEIARSVLQNRSRFTIFIYAIPQINPFAT